MEVSPARIAEMLTPLAEQHNAEHRRRAALPKADPDHIANPIPLTGNRLARVWIAIASLACTSHAPALPGLEATRACKATTIEIGEAADLSDRYAQMAVIVLERGGWIRRHFTGRAMALEPLMPAGYEAEPRHDSNSYVVSVEAASGGANLAAHLGEKQPMKNIRRVVSLTIHIDIVEGPDGADPRPQTARIRADGADSRPQTARNRAPGAGEDLRGRGFAPPDGADPRPQTARIRADGADSRPQTARNRAPDSPRALSKENQSMFSSPSSEENRSIDRSEMLREMVGKAAEGIGQTHVFAAIVTSRVKDLAFYGTERALVPLLRLHAPGKIFANLLAVLSARGSCDASQLWAACERDAAAWSADNHAWAFERGIVAYRGAGVELPMQCEAFALMSCPRVFAEVERTLDERRENVLRGAKTHRGPLKPIHSLGNMLVADFREYGKKYRAAIATAIAEYHGREKHAAESEAAAKLRATQEAAAKAKDAEERDRRRREADDIRKRFREATPDDLRAAVRYVIEKPARFEPAFVSRMRAISGQATFDYATLKNFRGHDEGDIGPDTYSLGSALTLSKWFGKSKGGTR